MSRAVEAVQPGTFDKILANNGINVGLGIIMKLFNASTYVALVKTITGWIEDYVRVKPEDWWGSLCD